MRQVTQWAKQLNVFKSHGDQSVEQIKQQQISTRLYFSLLAGMTNRLIPSNLDRLCLGFVLILLLFTSLTSDMVMWTESNPSLATFDNLQTSYKSTVKCPCSTMVIPFKKFVSFAPAFHQVCSSDFVTDHWIALLIVTNNNEFTDTSSQMVQSFRLLSALCELAKNTITDALERFSLQSLITSNVLNQASFNAQLDTTMERFIQSLLINFAFLTDATSLLTRVDQPFTKQPYVTGVTLDPDPAVYEPDLRQVCVHISSRCQK